MTRVDIQTRLQNHFNNNVYYTTLDLNDAIQDAVDEISAFTGCIYNSAVIPFTSGVSYYDMLTLLPDYIGVVAIFNATIRRWLYATSLRKLDQDRVDWETASGTPYYFIPVSHRYVAIYKKPTSANYGNMYVFYRASSPLLTDSATISVPDEFTPTIDDYCIMDLWEQNQEFSKASNQLQAYISNLDKLRTFMRSKRDPDRMQSLR